MGRPASLAILSAAALAAGPARGAEITRVLSSGEPDSPFAFSAEIRFERAQKSAKITREFGVFQSGQPGVIRDAVELSYKQVTDRVVPRLAVGLWRDLEFHLEMPYVIDDTPSWGYGTEGGASVQPRSAVDLNPIDASGNACAGSCPMFPSVAKLHAGAALDDLKLGLAWAIMNERRDDWSPTWVVSLDVTAPTAARFDPAAGRLDSASFFAAPTFGGGKKAAVGHKLWIYDLGTAMSKRVGKLEPYVKAGLRIPQKSSGTYSNCEHAGELAAMGQMSSAAPANCADPYWSSHAQARPPLVVGLLLGAEVAPLDEPARRFAVDLRVGSDFYSKGRWYDELTPATGKLMANEAYFTFTAQAGAIYRSGGLRFGLQYAFQHDFPHFISGEEMGHVSNELVNPNGPQQNPNYDFRWDMPGRRFRVADTLVHTVSLDLAWLY
jgi:hypothetical protein